MTSRNTWITRHFRSGSQSQATLFTTSLRRASPPFRSRTRKGHLETSPVPQRSFRSYSSPCAASTDNPPGNFRKQEPVYSSKLWGTQMLVNTWGHSLHRVGSPGAVQLISVCPTGRKPPHHGRRTNPHHASADFRHDKNQKTYPRSGRKDPTDLNRPNVPIRTPHSRSKLPARLVAHHRESGLSLLLELLRENLHEDPSPGGEAFEPKHGRCFALHLLFQRYCCCCFREKAKK